MLVSMMIGGCNLGNQDPKAEEKFDSQNCDISHDTDMRIEENEDVANTFQLGVPPYDTIESVPDKKEDFCDTDNLSSQLAGVVQLLDRIRTELKLLQSQITANEISYDCLRLVCLDSDIDEAINKLSRFTDDQPECSSSISDSVPSKLCHISFTNDGSYVETKVEAILKCQDEVKIEVDSDASLNPAEFVEQESQNKKDRFFEPKQDVQNDALKIESETKDGNFDESSETIMEELNPTSLRGSGSIKSRFKCVLCGDSFVGKQTRDSHVSLQHGEGPFQCSECDNSLKTYTKLRLHLNKHSKGKSPLVECQVCKKQLCKSSLKLHMKQHSSQGAAQHECDICNKKFVEASFLKRHVRTRHEGILPFHCDVCGKGFISRTGVKVHLVVHTGEKPYTCEQCGNSYSQKTHLRRHIAWTHEGKKPSPNNKSTSVGKLANGASAQKDKVMCGECGKMYSSSISLKVHQLTHAGVKPYSCDLCDKTFTQSGGLASHKKNVHTSPAQERVRCEVCNKSYKNEASLKMHAFSHTDTNTYQCEVCSKYYSTQKNLKRHVRVVHQGEKPFSCDVCQQKFSCSSILKQHMPVHTGEKAFKCDVCDKCFTQYSSLSVHKKKYH